MRIVPVIMCGGAGTRLWPASDRQCPKQFHRLISDKSVFQETVMRFTGTETLFAPPMIVTNAAYAGLVDDQLAEIGASAASILCEPEGRNTAAVAAMPAELLARGGPERLGLLVLSDHFIAQPGAFLAAVEEAASAAQSGRLVTFGISPTHPETGFGYIERGASLGGRMNEIAAFMEKPDAQTALAYLGTGKHAWNAGIFLFRAGSLLTEFEQYAPDILDACRAALHSARPDEFHIHPDKDIFLALRSISLDYAIVEHTKRAAVLAPLDCGWSDIGTWSVISAFSSRPNMPEPVEIASNNCFVQAGDNILVALVGVQNLIVVADGRRVLVSARDASQSVGEVVRVLRE